MSATPAVTEAPTAPARPGARVRRFEYHLMFLVLAVIVLVLSMTMSVRGEGTQVSLPFFDEPLPELCYLRRFTGMECPGCGMTRSFISLGHGDVVSAWRFNPAGVLLFGLFVAQIPYRSLQLWRIRRGEPEWCPRVLFAALTVALVSLLFIQWVFKLYFLVAR
jgi:hypothetical protein